MSDWPKILGELRSSGMTQKGISRFAGCGRAHIANLENGAIREPTHSVGSKILELYRRLCAKETT